MQTYSHLILAAILNRRVKQSQAQAEAPPTAPPMRSGPFLWGAVAPDLPLIVLTIGFIISDLMSGRTLNPGADGAAQSNTGYLFDTLFFQDPWVKLAHNLFHAPILTVLYTLTGYWLWKKGRKWGPALFWFGLSCTIHTVIDIPVHYNDGPLIFFPFDWETRFYSPLSYWDPARGGAWFFVFEHLLVLAMLIYLGITWWQRRRGHIAAPEKTAG